MLEKFQRVDIMPLGVPGLPVTTCSTDLIVDQSSSFPRFMPQPSMVDCNAPVAVGVNDNRDGILIISASGRRSYDPHHVALVRLLYTDSTHSLLLADRLNQTAREIASKQAEH